MNQHQIKLTYSQLTLKPLIEPYYHVEQGCQFDLSDLKQKAQSKQIICPICQKSGTLQQDVNLKVALFEKTDKQLISNKTNNSISQLYKTSFSHSNRSSDQNVLKQQIAFNSHINNGNIQLDINFIEKLNQERIREYFFLIKSLPNIDWIRKPTLIGVIGHRLILFFHRYKIKLELDLYEMKEKEQCQKMNQSNSGTITQVEFFQEKIQLIVQNQQIYQLYSGDLLQIFEPKNTEPTFKVRQLPGYTMKNFAWLIQKPEGECLMIGSDGIILLDYAGNEAILQPKCGVEGLNQYSYVVTAPNGTVIIANSESKNLEEAKYNKETVEIRQGLRLSSFQKFDGAVVYSHRMILINSDNLQLTNFTVQYVIQGNLNPTQQQVTNLNHSSFMKVIFIPSTPAKFESITCYLVGLQFQYEQQDVIIPGLLVYNNQKSSFEIELL